MKARDQDVLAGSQGWNDPAVFPFHVLAMVLAVFPFHSLVVFF